MRLTTKIAATIAFAAILNVGCGFKRKKYDNPITKDTQQPDKVLFDKAVHDIEHGHYETARLTLNTLINTYDTSEYLAKAKLAIADSWYREAGPHGLAQAEAEYKDFILFYPTMEEAAESQYKICKMHYDQMALADRDPNNGLRAEQECKTVITQFPNSKFVPDAMQRLRDIQEVLAESEFVTGHFYATRGSNAAAANRFKGLVDQYPLYSKADEALWEEANSFARMGPHFRPMEGEALQKLVRDYPLSPRAEEAKKRLRQLELSVPEADPAAVARMKEEQANRTKPGMRHEVMSMLSSHPDTHNAAKVGQPTMSNPKQMVPVTVPAVATAANTGVTDVTVAPVTDPTALDTKPDARTNPAAGAAAPPNSDGAKSPAAPASGTSTAAPASAGGSAAAPANATAAAAPPAANSSSAKDKKKKGTDKKKKGTDDKKSTTSSDK
jgi:outer membrane protein assembly factor BamD